MSGIFEQIIEQNQTIIQQNKELIRRIDHQGTKNTSWITVTFILNDLKISNKEFHQFWKKKMTFLRRAKGPGSDYRAVRWEYEEWKDKYWESLKNLCS